MVIINSYLFGFSMKIDISPLEKALGQLETSIGYLHSELAKNDRGLHEQFRNSAIQCFEFTYELCYRMIRRFLDQIVSTPDDLRQMNFADFVRTAAEAGLIPDVKRFLRYRERRNITSHTYDQKKAEEVIEVLDEFMNDIRIILKEFRKRNEPKTAH